MARANSSMLPASAQPLSAGRRLGDKFEIVGVLGEGGTGIVYDARRLDVQKDQRVALKVMHPHLAGDKQIRGRFTREAAILRRLQGEHLCPILEFGELPDPRRESNGLLYIVLPKVDGPGLDAILKKEGTLTIARSTDIMLDVCVALGEAHAQGVIHRDLKPGNVLVRDGDHAVVVDFGMAKIVTGGGTGTTALTQQNMVFGTPEYMAPEQARGDELDARCDIYAAGVILYELLTGSVPFLGATPLSVLTAHLTTPPQAPRKRAPTREISAALESVVLHAMAKDPAERYPTATALGDAIRRARATPEDVTAVVPPKRIVKVDARAEDAHSPTLPDLAQSERPPALEKIETLPPLEAKSSRGWTLLWIVAAIVGIALGVWLSLRS
jgi:serine/threonine-protein kinase